jgi:uncharacterized membrane protein
MAAATPAPSDVTGALRLGLGALGIVLAGANFGLFFAWVSTTMWGLDAAPAPIAVEAMQAMNSSVRNGVFAAVFFTAAPVLLLAGGISLATGAGRAGAILLGAGLVMLAWNNVFTFSVLVPMNEAFGLARPATLEAAQALWAAYSPDWQLLNALRTSFCGLSFALALWGGAALLRDA